MNLVVQGPALVAGGAGREVALLAKPQALGAGNRAARVSARRNAMKNAGIAAAGARARSIDYAWVPEGRRFADLQAAGDGHGLDADHHRVHRRARRLRRQEGRDRRDHRAGDARRDPTTGKPAPPGGAARRARPEPSLEQVYEERLQLTPGAETLLAACKQHGVKLLLVSGGFTFFTERLKARLGIDYTHLQRARGRGRALTGQLVGDIVDADAKAAKFRAVMRELGAQQASRPSPSATARTT